MARLLNSTWLSVIFPWFYNRSGEVFSVKGDANETTYSYDSADRANETRRENGLVSAWTHDVGGRLRALKHHKGNRTLAAFRYEVDARGNRTQAKELLEKASGTTTLTASDLDPAEGWTLRDGFLQATHKASVLSMTFTGSKEVQLTIGTGPDHGIFDVHIGGSLWQSIDGYASTAGQRVIAIPVTRTEARALEIRSRADKNRGSSGYVVRFKQLSIGAAYTERTIDYTYDALSRLVEAGYSDVSSSYTYGYDLAGNLTNKNGTMRTFNAGNQMTSDGTNTLTYDSNGNLTNDGTNAYTWDRANRMLTAPGGTAYQYDGLGNRVSQTVNSVVTNYLLDTQPGLTKVIAQTTGGNIDRFIHTPRGIHAMENNAGEWSYMVQDGLGSVRGVVDDGLRVDAVQSYDPYGHPDSDYGAGFGFTGEQTDGNGQVYLRARYYDPSLGVFASLDPFEGMMQRPMSLNGYSWVEGNVPNRVDPSGKSAALANQMNGGMCSNNGEFNCGYPFQENQIWNYVVCRVANRENPCPQTSNWRFTGVYYANAPVCENIYNSIGYTPVHAWKYELGFLPRRQDVLLRAFMLREMARRDEITDFEALAATADYSCSFGVSGVTVISDLSYIYAGSTGTFSLIESVGEFILDIFAGLAGLDSRSVPILNGPNGDTAFGNNGEVNMSKSGLHPDYDDGQNQLFHFIPYAVTTTYGGNLGNTLAVIGNYVHEDLGIPDFSRGASWQDSNLSLAGMALGYGVRNGSIQPCEIGDWIRNNLSQSVGFDYSGHPDSYPWVEACKFFGFPSCHPSVEYP